MKGIISTCKNHCQVFFITPPTHLLAQARLLFSDSKQLCYVLTSHPSDYKHISRVTQRGVSKQQPTHLDREHNRCREEETWRELWHSEPPGQPTKHLLYWQVALTLFSVYLHADERPYSTKKCSAAVHSFFLSLCLCLCTRVSLCVCLDVYLGVKERE